MYGLRHFLLRHRRLAALLAAMALCVKLLVPTGYMVGSSDGAAFTLQICNGQGGGALEVALPSKHDSGSQHDTGHGNDHCAFSALAMSGLTGADPLLLALQLAFILALGFAPIATPALQRRRYATPPLRGPPLTT